MDILERISKFRGERGWSEYQLAERSGVPQSTISSWYKKSMTPSFASLEKICNAFGVSMSQFFAESDNPIFLSENQYALLEKWELLTPLQKERFLSLIDAIVFPD